MIEIDQLITYYQLRTNGHSDSKVFTWDDIVTSTITYLVAFKQVHEMLKNLGDAIQGIDLNLDPLPGETEDTRDRAETKQNPHHTR